MGKKTNAAVRRATVVAQRRKEDHVDDKKKKVRVRNKKGDVNTPNKKQEKKKATFFPEKESLPEGREERGWKE